MPKLIYIGRVSSKLPWLSLYGRTVAASFPSASITPDAAMYTGLSGDDVYGVLEDVIPPAFSYGSNTGPWRYNFPDGSILKYHIFRGYPASGVYAPYSGSYYTATPLTDRLSESAAYALDKAIHELKGLPFTNPAGYTNVATANQINFDSADNLISNARTYIQGTTPVATTVLPGGTVETRQLGWSKTLPNGGVVARLFRVDGVTGAEEFFEGRVPLASIRPYAIKARFTTPPMVIEGSWGPIFSDQYGVVGAYISEEKQIVTRRVVWSTALSFTGKPGVTSKYKIRVAARDNFPAAATAFSGGLNASLLGGMDPFNSTWNKSALPNKDGTILSEAEIEVEVSPSVSETINPFFDPPPAPGETGYEQNHLRTIVEIDPFAIPAWVDSGNGATLFLESIERVTDTSSES